MALWFISARANQTLADELARQAFESRAHFTLTELERLRDTARAGAEALAANPIVNALTSEERRNEIPALATILRATPGVSAAYLGWPNGDFLLLRRLGETPAWVDAPEGAAWMVQRIEGGTPRFEFLDATLAWLEERQGVMYDLDPLSRPWFVAAQSTTGTVVTMPYVFFTTREPGLTAARQAPGGAVAGVDISLVDLSERLSGLDEPSKIVSAILDRNGGIVAYSDLERISVMMAVFAANADPRETSLPPAEDLGEPVLAALADEVRTGHDRFFRTERIAGVPWLVLAQPIDDQGTTMVVHAPRAAFASVAQDVTRNLLVLFVTATIVALALLALVARQVARPVEAMAREVDLLSTLDFRSESRVTSHVREFCRLGDAFTQMKTTLASYTDVLKDAIRQKDHDALIRNTLARLQAITEAERAIYWCCHDGRPVQEPLHDTGPTEAGLSPAQIPHNLPERIFALDSVTEITFADQDGPTDGTASSADRRILAIPLRSEDNHSIGAIAILCRPGAPALKQQVMAIAEAVSDSLGLVIDRRRLLGKHQAARRQSELVLAAVADGIHVLDTQGCIIEQNEAARGMLGWTVDEVRGRHAHALIHHHRPDGNSYPVDECPIFQTLADGRTRAASDEYFFRKDGRGFAVEYECSAMRNDGGAITGAVVSFRDLTERLSEQRRLRERVKELNCLYRVLELTLSSTRTIADVCAEIAQLLPESLLHESIASARIRVHAKEYRSPDWRPPATSLRAEIHNGTSVIGFVEVSYGQDNRHDHDPGAAQDRAQQPGAEYKLVHAAFRASACAA